MNKFGLLVGLVAAAVVLTTLVEFINLRSKVNMLQKEQVEKESVQDYECIDPAKFVLLSAELRTCESAAGILSEEYDKLEAQLRH